MLFWRFKVFVTVQSHLSEMVHFLLDIHDATEVIKLAEVTLGSRDPADLDIELLPKTVQVKY